MSEHIDAIINVVRLLRGAEKQLEDKKIVAVLLVSLPKSYSESVTAHEGRDKRDLTVEYVIEKIRDEYQRRTDAGATNESNGGDSDVGLKPAGASSKMNRYKNKNSFSMNVTPVKERKETRTCFYCHKPGHLQSEQRWYKKTQDWTKIESANTMLEVNAAQSSKSHIAFEARSKMENFRGWCMDFGATSHD
ncbi:hypothetical protein KM043_018233 [Ampulex compressa]|nr:hypothetical protein KM043_018233 [Ampulex compressa]